MVRSLVPARSGSGLALASLAVAPLLLVSAIAANQIGEALVAAGQVDRAVFGWFVVAPLVLLSPGAAALTWRATGRRQLAGRLVAGMSLAIGLAAEILLVLTITRIGCTPVDDPVQVRGARRPDRCRRRRRLRPRGDRGDGVGRHRGASWVVAIRSLIAGAVGLAAFAAAAILIFTATFAGVTCAAPQ